jgi:hypothetical protein
MRHGWTIYPILFVSVVAVGGFMPRAEGSEPTDDRLGERTVPILLLVRTDVQVDLKLSPDQVVACHRAAKAFQHRASRLIGRKDPAVVAARREIDEELTQWLTQQLSPQQLSRLEQVDLQWEGAAAMLNRPFLDNALNLSPDQKKQVGGYLAEGKAQRARGAWTYNDHVNLTRKAIAVLTDVQRDLWIRLLGPKCQFSIAAKAQPARDQPAISASSNSSQRLR